MTSYVVREQIFRHLDGRIAQARCEMSDGSILWEYANKRGQLTGEFHDSPLPPDPNGDLVLEGPLYVIGGKEVMTERQWRKWRKMD
jgi:hypothetical protein